MKEGYKMNDELLKKSLQEATYQRKEGTATSYYWKAGSRILPDRVGISKAPLTKVQKKGRMLLHQSVGQFAGNFKKLEQSPLKIYKPYTIRTQIWLNENFPQFLGYGTIGITSQEGGIKDTGDLIIFYSEEANQEIMRIFIFTGMGENPDMLDEAMKYTATII